MRSHARAHYIVSVSGGVDSVVLLDVLANQATASLTVAHFDHGIRENSRDDRLFVQNLARDYGLPFVYDEGRLGPNASEAVAREARYMFLRRAKEAAEATAIATAHHQDDVLETAIINLLRGTGRKGLSSLQSTEEIYRPLLTTPKANLITYAQAHGLEWREDSTNADPSYLRNYVRQRILVRFDESSRRQLRQHIDAAMLINAELDSLVIHQLELQPAHNELDRRWFISLPHAVAREIIAMWLREHGASGFNKKTIERLVAQCKTLMPGKQIDVDGRYKIAIKPNILALSPRDR